MRRKTTSFAEAPQKLTSSQSSTASAAVSSGSMKPALASIKDSCDYMGGVSRSKFYADILPELETIKLGNRHFVVVASMDRLIAGRSTRTAETGIEPAISAKLA